MFKQNFIQIQSHLSAFFLLLVIFSSCKSRSQQPSIPLIQQPDERSYYAALDDSIKADPQNPVYRYARAIGYQEKNRHKEAIVDLNIVVDYLKKNPH